MLPIGMYNFYTMKQQLDYGLLESVSLTKYALNEMFPAEA